MEPRYRDLYENAPVAYFSIGTDGRILDCNKAAESFLGYTAEELRKLKVLDLYAEESVPKAMQIFERFKQGVPVENEELVYIGKDGAIAHGLLSINPLKDKDGNVIASRSVVIDIGERRRIEGALRESEEKYRELFENMSSGVAMYEAVEGGEDFVFVDFNRAGERIEGVTRGSVVGRRVTEAFPGVEEFGLLEVFRRVWRTGEPEHFPLAQYRDERITGWRDNYVYRLPGGEIVAVYDDVTERKKAEENLRKSEEYHRKLVESAYDFFSVLNEEGSHRYISPSVKRVMGYEPGELMQKNSLDLIHPEDRQKAMEAFSGMTRSPGSEIHLEYRARHRDGTWRVQETVARNLLHDPVVRGIVANTRDITEQNLATEALKSINRLFLSLGADLIANLERIIAAAREILGAELVNYCRIERGRLICALSTAPGEAPRPVGKPEDHICYEVISGGGAPLVIEDLDATSYAESDPYVRRYGLRSFLGYPVVLEGKTMGCLSVFDTLRRSFSHDETELLGTLARATAIEEERLAREEEMKDFIDIASHELRHPVTLMKGYALSLRDLWERLDQEKIKDMLDAIDHGADRLNRLALGLLDLSRIERGRFRIEKRDAELTTLVEQVVDELRRGGARNEFGIDTPDGPVTIVVDPERIAELLIILLENAVKFSPPEAPVEIGISRGDSEVLVSVLDRGEGVPEDYRELVFQRFVQVEDAQHHSIPGMGMGLYIAREIVEAHRGMIWCEPRVGGGSAFRFTLPA
ncbi:MAG: PAS domain S-box protein [Actinomycetota bacterium]